MRRFQVNEPDVVFETFDEEIVAVNLETGNYYSLSGSGPAIWIDLVDGRSVEEVAARFETAGPVQTEAVAAQVSAFLERLVAEKLLVDRRRAPDAESPAAPDRRPTFTTPVIENYSDMQDLLMLDPIHEVDTAGWPVAKTTT